MLMTLQETLGGGGILLLVSAALLAGLVRGFSGFGTAMIFLPLAVQVVQPIWALTAMMVFDLVGPLVVVPQALRDAHRRDVLRLALGLCVALPLGVTALVLMAPETYRFVVSLLTLGLLVLLMSGLRWRGPLGRRMIFGTGALGGFLSGATGLAGPPVIMLYMASRHPPQVIRANILLYLLLADAATLLVFGFSGLITLAPVLLGLFLILPYMSGIWLGGRLFDPDREGLYRWVAYAIIAASALSGLPIWR